MPSNQRSPNRFNQELLNLLWGWRHQLHLLSLLLLSLLIHHPGKMLKRMKIRCSSVHSNHLPNNMWNPSKNPLLRQLYTMCRLLRLSPRNQCRSMSMNLQLGCSPPHLLYGLRFPRPLLWDNRAREILNLLRNQRTQEQECVLVVLLDGVAGGNSVLFVEVTQPSDSLNQWS